MRWITASCELEPLSALRALLPELDGIPGSPGGGGWRLSERRAFPRLNVASDRDAYLIRAEVCGLEPEHLTIEVADGRLTVRGKRQDAGVPEGTMHRRERQTGEFSRSLELPEEADLTKSHASYRHGILTVRIPKREEARPRQICVEGRSV